MYNPNRNIVEDRRYIEEYSFKNISGLLTRTKLVITLFEHIIDADMIVFYFFYPRFSYTCWVGIQLFIFFWDSRYLLTYLVLILIWIMGVYSEFWEKHITPITTELFFTQNLLHPTLMSTNKVLTMDEMNHVNSVNALLENAADEQL